MNRVFALGWVFAAVLSCVGCACAQTQNDPVVITLHLELPEGTTLPEHYVPDICPPVPTPDTVSSPIVPGIRVAGTNDFVFTTEIGPTVTKFFVNVFAMYGYPNRYSSPAPFTVEERLAAHTFVKRHFAGTEDIVVPLVAGQTNYSVSAVLHRAVRVSGKFVDSDGHAVRPFTIRSDGDDGGGRTYATAQRVDFWNVRANEEFFFAYECSFADGYVERVVRLSAQQMASDVDFGTITIDLITADVPVNIVVENAGTIPGVDVATFPMNYGLERRYLTLVREGGEYISVLDIEEGRTQERYEEGGPLLKPKVTAATYFVVPGSPSHSDNVKKVLRLTRAGHNAELIAAGVPRVVAVSGETLNATLDVADVITKIRAMPE